MSRRQRALKTPPREVSGYAEAWAAGLIPRVPATPPHLAVVPTARATFHTFLAATVTAFLAVLLSLKILDWVGAPGVATAVVGVLGGSLVFFLVFRLLARIGDRLVAEFRHGYTTMENFSGGFWVGQGYTDISGEVRASWDFRGLWLLDAKTGAVLRSPVPVGDPPGMYPSPHRPGRWELWTGAEWHGHFDSPADQK